MLFASITLGDLFGQACLMFIIIIWAIGWLVSKAAQNPEVQDAARWRGSGRGSFPDKANRGFEMEWFLTAAVVIALCVAAGIALGCALKKVITRRWPAALTYGVRHVRKHSLGRLSPKSQGLHDLLPSC